MRSPSGWRRLRAGLQTSPNHQMMTDLLQAGRCFPAYLLRLAQTSQGYRHSHMFDRHACSSDSGTTWSWGPSHVKHRSFLHPCGPYHVVGAAAAVAGRGCPRRVPLASGKAAENSRDTRWRQRPKDPRRCAMDIRAGQRTLMAGMIGQRSQTGGSSPMPGWMSGAETCSSSRCDRTCSLMTLARGE